MADYRGSGADCPQVANQHEQSHQKIAKSKEIWIAAKSQPTNTKFEPKGHKAVSELLLREHRPIWSQSMQNPMNAKNVGFLPKSLNGPDLRTHEELDEILWWKGSTHVLVHLR